VIAFFYFSKLPQSVQQMAPFLPYFLGFSVAMVALYFNTSALFYLGLVLLAVFLGGQTGLGILSIELLFGISCLIVLVVTLLPERGLFTWASLPIHIITWSLLSLGLGLASRQPDWLATWFETTWFVVEFLSAIKLPQILMLLWLLICLSLVVVWFLQQRRVIFNGIITLFSVLLLITATDQVVTLLTTSGGLLILLLSALQNAWHLAYVDELTALPGRRALQEKLQRSLGIYALAMVDVDHFKKFNDSYGHDVGDDVLRMIAAKIGAVAGGGMAYRYGGEEFTIVFNNHSADEIRQHLQAVIDDVAETAFVINRRKGQKPKPVHVTVSIGLTDSIGKANAAETIKTADMALYTAKKKGRNRLQLKR